MERGARGEEASLPPTNTNIHSFFFFMGGGGAGSSQAGLDKPALILRSWDCWGKRKTLLYLTLGLLYDCEWGQRSNRAGKQRFSAAHYQYSNSSLPITLPLSLPLSLPLKILCLVTTHLPLLSLNHPLFSSSIFSFPPPSFLLSFPDSSSLQVRLFSKAHPASKLPQTGCWRRLSPDLHSRPLLLQTGSQRGASSCGVHRLVTSLSPAHAVQLKSLFLAISKPKTFYQLWMFIAIWWLLTHSLSF